MQNSDFEGPPIHWSLLSIVGGIATAASLIVGLELGVRWFDPMRVDFREQATQVSPQVSSQAAK